VVGALKGDRSGPVLRSPTAQHAGNRVTPKVTACLPNFTHLISAFARPPAPLTSRFREITTRRTVTMPDRVSPHVKLVFAEMARQLARYQDIEDVSGVKRPTLKMWRRKNRPSLENLEWSAP
jgi:hypothetical protein